MWFERICFIADIANIDRLCEGTVNIDCLKLYGLPLQSSFGITPAMQVVARMGVFSFSGRLIGLNWVGSSNRYVDRWGGLCPTFACLLFPFCLSPSHSAHPVSWLLLLMETRARMENPHHYSRNLIHKWSPVNFAMLSTHKSRL